VQAFPKAKIDIPHQLEQQLYNELFKFKTHYIVGFAYDEKFYICDYNSNEDFETRQRAIDYFYETAVDEATTCLVYNEPLLCASHYEWIEMQQHYANEGLILFNCENPNRFVNCQTILI
jgi:hypothetical protein